MARPRTRPEQTATVTPARVEVRAQAKWVRTSPRKARLIAQHIRGRTVPEARTVLAFTQRAAARELEKVLRSAVANAEANHNLVGDELLVSAAYVDEGPTIKRWRARARGRVARIRKPTCHITVRLTPSAPTERAKAPKTDVPASVATAPSAEPARDEKPVEEKPKRAATKKATAEQEASSSAKPKASRRKS